MDFSKDAKMVAVGTTDSYIRVWSLDGKPLRSRLPAEKDLKVNNRRLVGHSAPVYSVAFSDAITNLDRNSRRSIYSRKLLSVKLRSCPRHFNMVHRMRLNSNSTASGLT